MALQNDLDAIHGNIQSNIPEEAALFDADTDEMIRKGVGGEALRVGDVAPDFTLPDHLGREVSSVELRKKGALVISFYRGSWCPYCNMELRALQQRLTQINQLGASLVAISPQVPDESLGTAQKNELAFPVLSDAGNVVAKRFGLVFVLSEHLRPVYSKFGIDLPKYNGNQSFELPVPATYVLDRNGLVLKQHVSADYKQRMEPEQILEVLTEL